MATEQDTPAPGHIPTLQDMAEELVQAPRGRGRGRALFALGLGGLGIGTGEFVPMGLLPQIAEGVEVGVTTAGHTISAYALGVVVGAPTIAVATARLPRRPLLIALMAAFVLGNVLSALAPNYLALFWARFLTGLPHGAFFGIAMLVAAAMVPAARRTWAVAQVALGLSVANLAIVPALTVLGQQVSWRAAFGLVAVIGVATAILVFTYVPDPPVSEGASPLRELGALRRPAVLLIAAIGSIGFAGMFAVYTYIAPILTERGGLPDAHVPIALVIWGSGMVLSNVWLVRYVDRSPDLGLMLIMVGFVAALLLFALVSREAWAAAGVTFLIGVLGGALPPALQARLMDVAGDAQTLAATMNHAAFNLANALGAFAAGIAYDASGTWLAPPLVGAALSAGGIALFWALLILQRRPSAVTT